MLTEIKLHHLSTANPITAPPTVLLSMVTAMPSLAASRGLKEQRYVRTVANLYPNCFRVFVFL